LTTFINYSSGQDYYVTFVQDTLNRLVGVDPYVAERNGLAGADLKTKILSMLRSSNLMVSILTRTTDDTWQNQEIGVFYDRKPNNIIPLKEATFAIKGLLEGKEYITIQPPSNLGQTAYELIGS
jgi:hypothetical protein